MNSEEEIKTTDHFVISLYRSPVFQGLLQDIKVSIISFLSAMDDDSFEDSIELYEIVKK